MIQIYMLNRGEDRARFLRGEPIAVGPGVIVQLESRLTAQAKTAATAPSGNGSGRPRKKATRQQYSDTTKQAILAEMKKTGQSYYQAAKAHGISPSVVLRWTKSKKKATA
jgi:transcriptional regulator with PAS, ATPase and Fis domain